MLAGSSVECTECGRETDDLKAYDPSEDAKELPAPVSEEMVKQILEKLKLASQPLILPVTGSGWQEPMMNFSIWWNFSESRW